MSVEFEKSHSTSKRDRIGSRLTPFEKLPKIGSNHEYSPRPPSTNREAINPRAKQVLKQKSIIIAIRLSDGRRLQREFYAHDTILDVVRYVKSQQLENKDDIYLSSADVPKREFKDFNLTLSEANISSRTMLYVDRY